LDLRFCSGLQQLPAGLDLLKGIARLWGCKGLGH
jgi:hypothetical protein